MQEVIFHLCFYFFTSASVYQFILLAERSQNLSEKFNDEQIKTSGLFISHNF